MNMTYRGCVHTFNNDLMGVKNIHRLSSWSKQKYPFRITIGKNKDMMTIIGEHQQKLKDIVTITLKRGSKLYHWGILHSHLCLLFPRALLQLFKLWVMWLRHGIFICLITPLSVSQSSQRKNCLRALLQYLIIPPRIPSSQQMKLLMWKH